MSYMNNNLKKTRYITAILQLSCEIDHSSHNKCHIHKELIKTMSASLLKSIQSYDSHYYY